jgi:PKD repeat protein
MKKLLTLCLIVLSGTIHCIAQPADSGHVDPQPACQAGFTYYYNDSIKTFAEAYPYRFIDQSVGNVVQWKWEFGDGKVSDERNPLHFYSHAGDSVLICLTITTADNCVSSSCKRLLVGNFPPFPPVPPDTVPQCKAFWMAYPDMLMVPSQPGTSDTSASPLPGNYFFRDMSKGSVVEWNWNFDDGTTSTEPNPVHHFGNNGLYTVCLKINTSDNCTSYFCDSVYVGIAPHCQASFTHYALPWVSSVPPIYEFNDHSAGQVISRSWDLGDGTVTNDSIPRHRYQFSGMYTVCLTINTASGCTSTSCETSWYDGANPQPGLCAHFIRLSTDIILNGQSCNGTASVSLVDQNGQPAPALKYVWSTGESGPTISGLCPGMDYNVIVIDSAGCAISGSFAFGGSVTIPDSLIGYWNFEQNNMSFIFNVPVYSDSVRCVWDFGDGQSAAGSSVSHTYNNGDTYQVALQVYDKQGNLLFTQEIPVTPGSPTGLKNNEKGEPEVYPVPAGNTLFIRPGERYRDLLKIEVINANGQVLKIRSFDQEPAESTIQIDVSSLTPGFYMGRLIYQDGSQGKFRFVK